MSWVRLGITLAFCNLFAVFTLNLLYAIWSHIFSAGWYIVSCRTWDIRISWKKGNYAWIQGILSFKWVSMGCLVVWGERCHSIVFYLINVRSVKYTKSLWDVAAPGENPKGFGTLRKEISARAFLRCRYACGKLSLNTDCLLGKCLYHSFVQILCVVFSLDLPFCNPFWTPPPPQVSYNSGTSQKFDSSTTY